jgi:hypothetical protein
LLWINPSHPEYMDEQNPEAELVDSSPPFIDHKDRSTGLIVFGVLTILLGCACALLAPLMLFGQIMSAKATGTPLNLSALLPVASVYGLLAVALVWLGIGSLKARRWARALLLILSWSWLVMGIVMLIAMAFLMPKMLANVAVNGSPGHPPMPGFMTTVIIVTLAVFGVFFVLVPGIGAVFYGSRHVKATCEARNPGVCWTDGCPLPVLACSLWLAFGAAMMLILPITSHSVMPFFGVFLTGLSGTVSYLIVAAIWGYAAWALYKLQGWGWWLISIGLCLYLASALITFARHDVVEMYRLMGYPEGQIQLPQRSNLLAGSGMTWLMVFCMAPWLAYLIFIKRYFRRQPPTPPKS